MSILKDFRSHATFVQDVNDLLVRLSQKECLPLGPDYKNLPPADAERNLALYRLKKKFEVPGSEIPNLGDIAITRALAYDQSGITEFVPARLPLNPDTRKDLYRLRQIIHDTCSGFKIRNTFTYSPGDTFASLRGDQSLFKKLKSRSNWTVTPDCFDRAAGLIYRNRYLKKAAKAHMPSYSRKENDLLWFACGDAFEVFKNKLLDFITIVEGSKLSTVPKNNSERRVINIEPFLNMVVQLDIASSLLDCLSHNLGYSKERAQDLHRAMIRDLHFATIDLSKASDSNWLAVIKWLFPLKIYKALYHARSHRSLYKGKWYDLNMISPMGNGFTFEVMTFALLCATRVFTRDASVYGDDIIIPRIHHSRFVELITTLGYKINLNKTFTEGNFRESCGGFYSHDGVSGGYLKSFDFYYAQDPLDAVVNVNKLIALRDVLISSSELKTFIQDKVPAILQMQGPESFQLANGKFKRIGSDGYEKRDIMPTSGECACIPWDLMNVRRSKRKDKEWTGKYIPVLKKHLKKQMSLYQHDHRTCDFAMIIERKAHDYVTYGRWKKCPIDDVNNVFIHGHYFHSGRCLAPTLRNEEYLTTRFVVY